MAVLFLAFDFSGSCITLRAQRVSKPLLDMSRRTPLFASLVVALLLLLGGCDRTETPGEPESNSAFADVEARTDFDGKLSAEVAALEADGEDASVEFAIQNITEESIDVARKDFLFASDSADWLRPKDGPELVTLEPEQKRTVTVVVAMPADQINAVNLGNLTVEVPEVQGRDPDIRQAEPGGTGLQRVEEEAEE
jgi:hypothetical protein